MMMKNFAVSAGSACSSESLTASYVLRAIGLSEEDAFCSLRIGIGRYSTEKEVDEFVEKLASSVKAIR